MGRTKKMNMRNRKNDLVEGSKKKKRIEKGEQTNSKRKRKNDSVEEEQETNGFIIRKCPTNKKPKVKKIGTHKEHEEEEGRSIQVGDTVNLSDLLFTKNRDYLVKFNQNTTQVKAKELAGKVIVLQFMSLVHGPFFCNKVLKHMSDIYTKLHPAGNFEIVFVAVRDDISDDQTPARSTPRKRFLERFSKMAWPAIPFSDLQTRKHLERLFAINWAVDVMPHSFIIDPRGVVLQSHGTNLFFRYGAAAFPFTNERIEFLDSEDVVAKMNPSMTNLFASPERDYLITNKGDQVPIGNLEDKVVAIYFCPDLFNKPFTMKLKLAYEELSKNKDDFEVVLIYTHGWWDMYRHTDEYSFWKAFQTMPWLALPFEDTNCNKKLQRIFSYPQELMGMEPDPRLVIIGPHGKFMEPRGANLLLNYGAAAYPFTISKAVALEFEMVKDVELETFWDPDAIFRKKDGSQVRFSEIVGKRIIVLFQNWRSTLECMLKDLKARYLKMKGTDDEFEVIYMYDGNGSERVAAAMPWLIYPCFGENSYALKSINRVFGGESGLLAYDCDGALVRRTKYPTAEGSMVFPFYYKGDMIDEMVLDLECDLDRKYAKLRCQEVAIQSLQLAHQHISSEHGRLAYEDGSYVIRVIMVKNCKK